MEGPVKGVEFLAKLREKGGRKKPNFRDLTSFIDQKARQKGKPVRHFTEDMEEIG